MSEHEELQIPEISPNELAALLRERSELVLLDVREPYEFPRAAFPDSRVMHAPLSDLARKHTSGLPEQMHSDPTVPVIVFCHHGVRSAQVTMWLKTLGWNDVYNLAGGIDAYARQIDPTIGLY